MDRQFISFTGTKNKVKHIRHTSNRSWAMAALTNIPRGVLSGLLWAIGICGMGVPWRDRQTVTGSKMQTDVITVWPCPRVIPVTATPSRIRMIEICAWRR